MGYRVLPWFSRPRAQSSSVMKRASSELVRVVYSTLQAHLISVVGMLDDGCQLDNFNRLVVLYITLVGKEG